jgi:hypothetical protein
VVAGTALSGAETTGVFDMTVRGRTTNIFLKAVAEALEDDQKL